MTDPTRTTILAAFVLLASALSASAQIPLGSEFRVDTGGFATRPYQNHRAVAMAPDGRFVVAWETSTAYFDHDVFARRFDAAGMALGPDFPVNTYTSGWQHDQSLGIDDAGNFVVVWASDPGGSPLVVGQRFDALGVRLGAEFRVSTNFGFEPSIAVAPGGDFVVVWEAGDGSGAGILGERYDASGDRVGAEFQVNTYTTGHQRRPNVDVDGASNFVVIWDSGNDCCFGPRVVVGQGFAANGVPQGMEFAVSSTVNGPQKHARVARNRDGSFVVAWLETNSGFYARRFDASGLPLGAEFRVDDYTYAGSSHSPPDLDTDADGDFVITWATWGQDGSDYGVFGKRFDSSGLGTSEFRVNTYTTASQASPGIASDPAGNFIIVWLSSQNGVDGVFAQRYAGGLMGTALSVEDSSGNANGVFEAQETVTVVPSWLNANFGAQTFTGTALSFTGPGTPGNPTYTIIDGAARYGTVPSGATADCTATTDCYAVQISFPGTRPAVHWDATFREEISPANLGAAKNWTLHIGDSFADVARASGFYRFIETVLHHSVTGGCSATQYCPASSTTREQMAVFVLVAKDGAGNIPPACTTPMFNDVPASSPFCRWIEELARRGVVAGCGGGNYCPAAAVTREQMSVFVLRALNPALVPPACAPPNLFGDVPETSPFCRWIEELARRGVVAGCGGGNYCPTQPVTREQMAVFLSVTFGLLLYGP